MFTYDITEHNRKILTEWICDSTNVIGAFKTTEGNPTHRDYDTFTLNYDVADERDNAHAATVNGRLRNISLYGFGQRLDNNPMFEVDNAAKKGVKERPDQLFC